MASRAVRLAGGVAFVLVAGALAWLLARPPGLPEGPLPVSWNRERCARCGMLVGEPAFAAQVQTPDGKVLSFDDPGCLLLHEAEQHPPRHAVWLHHHAEARWVRLEAAAFVAVERPTPMGYGLGAIERGTAPNPLTPAEALQRVRARDAARPAE